MSRNWPVSAALLCALAVGAACAPATVPTGDRAVPSAASAAPAATAREPAAASSQAPAAPRPTEQVKVAFAADSAFYAPHFIAIDKGYYTDEGLEIEIVKAGGGVATPALISGDLNYSTSAASALSAILKEAPLKIVYTNADRPRYEIWSTGPEVRSLADLPGKSVGVQSRGDTLEISARMLFQQQGLDPNAVIYAAVGLGAQRLGALQTGSVAAMVLTTADVAQLHDSMPRGVRLADTGQIQSSYMGLATSDRELQENRERVRRFLRATVKGREYFKTYREEAIDLLTRWNGLPRSANDVDYDDARSAMTAEGWIPLAVQAPDAALRAELNGVDRAPPPEQMYDYSLVQDVYRELQASGWQPTR